VSPREHIPRGNGPARPRLLVVPHVFADNISVREIEFARRLTRHFDVYCLIWNDALHVDDENALKRRWKQFLAALRSVVTRQSLRTPWEGVTYVTAPVLQTILLQRAIGAIRTARICQSFNRRTIESLTDRLHISHLLLATGTFGFPRRAGVRRYFDIVDWIPEDAYSPGMMEFIRKELRSVASQVDGVFAVSDPLSEKLRKDCGIEAIPLPNGADLAALRGVSAAETAALRSSLGVDGKFVIGYIGNHGNYTGVDFVVEMFGHVRKRIPNATLLIVGPAECWRTLLEAKRGEDVIWTGAVPPAEVRKYFNVLDLGVLAQGKTLGTEFAFQLKIVEYSACRKFVVATPLQTWERLAWPNVFLTELKVEAWVEAIVKAQQAKWESDWDTLIEAFDWNVLADRMAAVMLGGAQEAPKCES
jgi:glycosyltransferase involved in cell wall biosynthesis